MKILIVHQYYLMPGQSGGSRFNEMARIWAERGHEVSVIAGTVDHGTGGTPQRYRGRWVTKESDGAVTVYRCHVPGSYRTSYAGRMWAFLGFTLSSATAALFAPRPDVVIATSPPLVAVIPGWIAARCSFRPIPWIFEVRDLWPESAITTGVIGRKSILARLLYRIERWACRSASKINVLTPAFKEDIEKRGLAPSGKLVFVPNGADTEAFRPGPRDNAARREFGWGERFVAVYAGAHGRANALDQLVSAAERLRGRSDILIACVGDGPERSRLENAAAELGLSNIRFYGARAKDEMPEIVNAGDAGIAVLQNNPTFRTVYPNKVFDYMSCARPVILGIDGVARNLVCDQAGAGIFVQPENAVAIAGAILELAADPVRRDELGSNGRRWIMAHYSWEALAADYLEIMQKLARLPVGDPVPAGRAGLSAARSLDVIRSSDDE
jgi:glycosyltransferase involved in cell wall biosynthesis